MKNKKFETISLIYQDGSLVELSIKQNSDTKHFIDYIKFHEENPSPHTELNPIVTS